MTPLIEACNLTIRRRGRLLLDAIDLSVGDTEMLTIVGPNGSGKTTLIRALLGLEPLSGGSVRRAPGLTIGYLPQKLHIDPVLPLTVKRLMTLTRRATEATVRAALEETGVAHLIEAQAHGLSGGELQRVLLARALLCEPRLLVLDEPTQGVDFVGEIELYDLITQVRRHRQCAVLMISHDLHVVMAETDRVLCLHHHICCEGRPETVTRHPEYRRLFGDRADRLAVYTHRHHDHSHSHSQCHAPPPPSPDTEKTTRP